ncbi:MAG: DUF1404 domain-containing protein [Saccharolobus sp.]
MKLLREELKWSNLLLPVVLLLIVVNPFYERIETSFQPLYMTAHYILVLSGILIGNKILREKNYYSLILGIIPIVFWHIPLYYNLAGAFVSFRALSELTLFLGGLLIGSNINFMTNILKVGLLVVWMSFDSLLSVLLIVSWPYYSNLMYSFSPWPLDQSPITGILMFLIMTVLLIYALIKIFKNVFKIF